MPRDLPDRRLLRCAGVDFDVRAVVAAADLRGELGPFVEALSRRAAAATRVDNRTLQHALTAFRKARSLTAADDFKAWMARWGLTLDDVADHLERTLATPGDASTDDSTDAHGALYAELVCTGTLDRWTGELARTLAVWAEHPDERAPDPPPPCPVAGLPATTWQHLWDAWAAYRRRADDLLDDRRLRRILETRTLDLVRFTLRALPASDEDVARELLLCLRVDDMTARDAAALAGVPVQQVDRYALDLDPASRRELLAGVPGQVLGPFQTGDGWVVLQVVRKELPTLADPRVRALLVEQARDQAFGPLVRRHVTAA